jgi:hypothetical protein
MSAKKADDKKAAEAAPAEAPASQEAPAEKKIDYTVANKLIADLDRVHVRTPRY